MAEGLERGMVEGRQPGPSPPLRPHPCATACKRIAEYLRLQGYQEPLVTLHEDGTISIWFPPEQPRVDMTEELDLLEKCRERIKHILDRLGGNNAS